MLDDTYLYPSDGQYNRGCGAGRRELPASVAAAILLSMDYAGAARPGDRYTVWGCLPPHLCFFEGTPWCEDWSGTRDAIQLTTTGGTTAVFVPPPGFREMFDATMLLAGELRLEVRRAILATHPTVELGPVVDDTGAAVRFIGTEGRYGLLVAEVWHDLREIASTAHGRLALISERRTSVPGGGGDAP